MVDDTIEQLRFLDLIDAADTIQRLRTVGDVLERELMKLHRNHHGENCDTCKALLDWWNATGR